MSPLNDLEHFHVANNQLPQDVIHIMLEGVLPYEVQLMLTVFVKDKKYFTLDRLNERIKCYPYTQEEVGDRLSPIVLGTSSSQVAIHQSGNDNLNLHAAQYLKIQLTCIHQINSLQVNLPLVGSWPEESWFNCERKICNIILVNLQLLRCGCLASIYHWLLAVKFHLKNHYGNVFAIARHFTNHNSSYSFTWPGCVSGCVDTWPPQHVPSMLPYCFHYTQNALYGAFSFPNSQVSHLLLLLKDVFHIMIYLWKCAYPTKCCA